MSSRNFFGLIRPCPKCPFRNDLDPYIRAGRAEEIADALRGDQSFLCHQTTTHTEGDDGDELTLTGDEMHCAGAMIVLEKEDAPNQMMRIGARIGSYDPARLDMGAPVYDDLDEWVQVVSDWEVDGWQ